MRILLLGIFSIVSVLIFGQNTPCSSMISGQITDKETKEKLAFATIYVAEIKSGAVSDEQGNFTLRNLCPGNYTLRIEHLGCHPYTRKISVAKDTITLIIKMDHGAHELEAVQVSAYRDEISVGHSVEKLEGRLLQQIHGHNLGTMLNRLSGVTMIQTGSNVAKPVIHGMHSNRVLILNNGIRQEGQNWGAEHAPEIDPFIAKKIEVVKGANSVKYGSDAIAGVILVEPGELPDTVGMTGELHLVGISNGQAGITSGNIQGKLAKIPQLSFGIQGTLKRSGDQKTPTYYLQNTGVFEKNFSTSIKFQNKWLSSTIYYSQFNSNIGIYTGSHLGNLSDLVQAYNQLNVPSKGAFSYKLGRPYQQITHELLKWKSTINFKNLNALSVTYSRQFNERFEYDRHLPKNDSLAALNKPEFQFYITTHLLDVEYKLHHHNHLEGSFGANLSYQRNSYNGREFIPNYKSNGLGVFWVERYHTGPWQFELGARVDQKNLIVYKVIQGKVTTPSYRYFKPTGSLGLTYSIAPEITVGYLSATAWRAPAISEMYSNGLHHGSATIEVGTDNLLPETSWNNSLTFTILKKHLEGEVTLYHNKLNGFINLVPSGTSSLTVRGAFPVYNYVQQNAVFKGIDAHLKFLLNNQLNLLAQYTLVRAKDVDTKSWISQIPADRYRLGIEKSCFKNLVKASIHGTYTSKQTRYQKQEYVATSGQIAEKISDFAPPPPGYFLLEAQISCDFIIKNQPLLFSISCQNLLNKTYRDYLNRFRYFSDEVGRSVQFKLTIPLTIKSTDYEN